MQRVFEKIKERLEELKKIEKERSDSCDENGDGDGEDIFDDGRSQGRYEQTVRIIKIVNQVAEEYEHDFCEWKKYEDKRINYYKNCRWRDEDMDQLTVRHFYYCPYCGKKIKVVK